MGKHPTKSGVGRGSLRTLITVCYTGKQRKKSVGMSGGCVSWTFTGVIHIRIQ